MAQVNYFPEKTKLRPIIYAIEVPGVPGYKGFIKIGDTSRPINVRLRELEGALHVKPKLLKIWPAMKNTGERFRDFAVHNVLEARGYKRHSVNEGDNEFFKCKISDIDAAIIAVKEGIENVENRTMDFSMRPEQEAAVNKAIAYYNSVQKEKDNNAPRFLWNAKMRFGKTFAAYQLVKKMGLKRVLILTFKPAVQSAWREDLLTHIDFEGWQFISQSGRNDGVSIDEQCRRANEENPIVCFGSFQDFLGVDRETGGIKVKNEWVHNTEWDLVIFDEYHFGAWKDNARSLFEEDEDSYGVDLSNYDAGNACNESWLPITANRYLFLSGTPFRALNSGEFIEEQIYSWTYADEQRAKEEYEGEDNPYAALPRMVMLAYQLPEHIRDFMQQGDNDEFDLNTFFYAEGEKENARFKYAEYVQKWLDFIRASHFLETSADEIKMGAEKPALPYSDIRLLNVLTHTVWFLPNVASCYAMKNLLMQRNNTFFHDYKINVCAGPEAGIGVEALKPVLKSMEDDPLESKTITLSCGKLLTGVTVKPWTGIFMLRNMSSAETYFQAAFRVQSPWEITDDYGKKEIVKKECYVFDFALNRALRQITEYSCDLNPHEKDPEKNIKEFIRFFPIIAYEGSRMYQVDAGKILDIMTTGTSATLLARRWESALLVNVDNDTLKRLLANEAAMKALSSLEGFRSLNRDIEAIINKSSVVQKARLGGERLTKKKKKEISAAEKEYKSKRKWIQERLIKFATRVPVFMYLTDFRELSLEDVITEVEPELFKKVTGIEVKDFELLVSLNVFNAGLMNKAVFNFKRYEDASLTYTDIDKHSEEQIGLYNTVISKKDYDTMSG